MAGDCPGMIRHVIGALKRILWSLISAAVAVIVCSLLFSLFGSMRHPWNFQGFGAVWVYCIAVLVGFGYRAWIIAIPAVVFLTNARSWRFWALLGLGTCIGPFTFYLEMIFWGGGRQSVDPFGTLVSAIVSLTASLIYLLLLRRSQGGVTRRDRLQRLFDNA